jgi:hypothetical protein
MVKNSRRYRTAPGTVDGRSVIRVEKSENAFPWNARRASTMNDNGKRRWYSDSRDGGRTIDFRNG